MSSPGKKQSNTKKALKAFKEWDKNRTPIYNNGKEPFQAADDEIFVQSDYEKTWFVSNYGNIISFNDANNPKLIQPRTDTKRKNKGRERYFAYKKQGKMSYELTAKAFGAYVFGTAKAKCIKDKYDIHHIRAFDSSKGRAYNNDPEFVEYVTKQVHALLTNIQEHQGQPTINRMNSIANIAEKEAPGKAVVITDGGKDHVGIVSMDANEIIEKLKQSTYYAKICDLYYQHIINQSLDTLIKIRGEEYFEGGKYVFVQIRNYTIIYLIKKNYDKIDIIDITNKNLENGASINADVIIDFTQKGGFLNVDI